MVSRIFCFYLKIFDIKNGKKFEGFRESLVLKSNALDKIIKKIIAHENRAFCSSVSITFP